MLNSEQGNHKRLGLSVYSCSQDRISSVGRDGKGTAMVIFSLEQGSFLENWEERDN